MSGEIKESDEAKDLLNISKDDFKHLKPDTSYGFEVIIKFYSADKKLLAKLKNTLDDENFDWLIPCGYSGRIHIENNVLTVECSEGDENIEDRLEILAKYIPTVKIELKTIRTEYSTFNETVECPYF